MYACKQCGTGNPLDSSFCKKCGGVLPEEELVEARIKLAEMLEEGNDLFTQGRTDEAMLIAEAAVAANPSSHMAYSLKGLCHERMGQISEALECYEIAVGLNPDSSLDKVKVAALRNRLAQRLSDVPEPNRKNAAMVATAAVVLVLVAGSLAAIGMRGAHDTAKVVANTTPNPTNSLLETPNSNAAGTTPGGTNTPQGQGGPSGTPNTGITVPQPDPNQRIGLPNIPANGGLPVVEGTATVVPIENPTPLRPGGIPQGPIGQPTTGSGNPDPAPGPLHSDTNALAAPTKPPEDDGYINITVTHPGKTLGGSGPATDGAEVTSVLKTAQQMFQLGHYDSAASKYRHVAEIGGDSPKIEQRIGDCFRNLARPEQARSAYNRAINLYQTQIKLGHDVAGNQRGLDSCESALKVLGG